MRHLRATNSFTRLGICLLSPLVLVLAGHETRAAELALCPAQTELPQSTYLRTLYGAGGAAQQLLISQDGLANQECETLSLPELPADVVWASPVPQALVTTVDTRNVILQGLFPRQPDQPVAVSEVIPLRRTASPASNTPVFRFGANQISAVQAMPFGIEERASWRDGLMSCGAGSVPAGVLLRLAPSWPAVQRTRLLIRAAGQGEFALAISDPTRQAAESPLPLTSLNLDADTDTTPRSFYLPVNEQPWTGLTLVCPSRAARLQISSLRVIPEFPATAVPPTAARSAWLWSPDLWQGEARDLWQIQSRQRLEQLFVTIPVSPEGQLDNAALVGFLAEARARDVEVWPVIGDRRDVLSASLPALRNRLSAYAAFNRDAAGAGLAGVQLDIEPYLLQGFDLDIEHWQQRYIETLREVRATVGDDLRIDLVVPVWWGSHPRWGNDFLDRLAAFDVSLTVMNYRTSQQRLFNESLPFLVWGEHHGRAVRIALESGTLADEQRRTYAGAERQGELWQFQLGASTVLVLFDRPLSDLPGDAFVQVDEGVYSASQLTFAGDLQSLNEAAATLSQSLSPWRAFAGIALHGLDEVYARMQQ